MTPQEEAIKLYDSMYAELYSLTVLRPRVAKQCAITAQKRVVDVLGKIPTEGRSAFETVVIRSNELAILKALEEL